MNSNLRSPITTAALLLAVACASAGDGKISKAPVPPEPESWEFKLAVREEAHAGEKPHLHTHCIVFNATYDATEDRWKALQNHDLLAAQKCVENVYYPELTRTLRRFAYTIVNSAIRTAPERYLGLSGKQDGVVSTIPQSKPHRNT